MTTAIIEFENAAVRLVGCMHPHDNRIVPNRASPLRVEGRIELVLCELCGSATRDDGRTWKAPMLVEALAESTNSLAIERARTGSR